jgi:hypothetical protein
MTGSYGRTWNISNSTSTMHRVCLAIQLHLTRTNPYSTLCGHRESKNLTNAKRHNVSAMGPCIGLVKVLNGAYPNCLDQTSSQLFHAVTARKTSLLLAQMYLMLLLKLPCLNRASISSQIKHSTTGG